MRSEWKYPIMIFHRKLLIEVIDNTSVMYTSYSKSPILFKGEMFIDITGILWKIKNVKSLGGRPPHNGWRFPWSTPSRLFAREINYEIEAEKLKQMTFSEIKEMVLSEVNDDEFWYEALEMPEWKEKLFSYATIEQIFNDFRV